MTTYPTPARLRRRRAQELRAVSGTCTGEAMISVVLVLAVFAATAAADTSEFEVQKLAETVSLVTEIRGESRINMVASVGLDGVLLSDALLSPESLGEALEALGTAVSSLRFVVNTHYHGDHTGGNRILDQGSHLIVAHPATLASLADGAPYGPEPALAESQRPGVLVDSKLRLRFNGEMVEIFSLAGAHTGGDLGVSFEGSGVVHVGDVLLAPRAFPYARDLDAFETALEEILARCDAATVVVPGHGPPADAADVETLLELVRESRSWVRSRLAAGADLESLVAAAPAGWQEWTSSFQTVRQWLGKVARHESRSAESERRAAELGDVSFAAVGAEAAQPVFQRGIAALHSFWYGMAADAFRETREIDPGFILAYWGEAMTHYHPLWSQLDLDQGRAILGALGATTDERLGRARDARERGLLAAVEELYFGNGPEDDRREGFARGLRAVADRHPDDVDLAAFAAVSELGTFPLGTDPRQAMRIAAGLEPWLDRSPRHPGVLHYLIHAYDDPVHAPLGLRAARTYAEVAPASPHALHMPSHIFIQIGRWSEASASNEEAYRVSIPAAAAAGDPIGQRDYHSLSWLLYSYLQEGRQEEAQGLLDHVDELLAEEAKDELREVALTMRASFIAETGRWSQAEEWLADAVENGSRRALLVLGLAAVKRGDLGRADAMVRALETVAGEARQEGHGRLAALAAINRLEVEAALARERGDPGRALAALEEAVAVSEALGPPIGPPSELVPAHEALAALLLAMSRPQEALAVVEQALSRTPSRAAALALRERAAAAGRSSGQG